jgi:hypothetical protein
MVSLTEMAAAKKAAGTGLKTSDDVALPEKSRIWESPGACPLVAWVM